jgi:hypothetical protein
MPAAQPLSRRRALHLLGGAALAAMPVFRLAGEVDAARSWCRADPLLRIAGQSVHVYISSTTAMLQSATDKIRLTVTLPSGVEGRKLDVLADFGKGYDIRFLSSSTLKVVNGRVPVLVAVYCPARDSTLPVIVDFAPVGTGPLTAGSTTGTANSWVSLLAS